MGGEERIYAVEACFLDRGKGRVNSKRLVGDALGVGRWRIEVTVFGIHILHHEVRDSVDE